MPSKPDQQQRLSFRALIPEGSVELTFIDNQSKDFDSISATLELSKHEALIQTLENWLGYGLEFQYVPSTHITPALFTAVSVDDVQQAIEVSVSPQAWVYKMGILPDFTIKSHQFRWARHFAGLDFCSVSLSDRDLKRLTKGALLLLPGAFKEEWNVDLIIPALTYRQSGLLVKDPFRWQGLLAYPDIDQPDKVTAASARDNVGCYFELSADLLVKHGTELNTYINNKLDEAACVLKTGDDRKFTGHLTPVGAGYGLRIENSLE